MIAVLDSLHEEVNIRLDKPYLENPCSDDRDEDDLRTEYWSNFLRRNWSFVCFAVYGQLRSFIKCLECDYHKFSFETFSTLSLPLPESSTITLWLVLFLLPEEIKLILNNSSVDHILGYDKIELNRK